MKLVLFTLAKQTFAIDVRQVREVIRVAEIVPIPDVPPWLEGIIHLRGVMVPLIDLHEKLHIPQRNDGSPDRVIVSHATHCRFGVLVDMVKGVITLQESEVNPPDEVIRHAASVAAVAFYEGQLIPILDLNRLLTIEDTQGIQLSGVPETVPVSEHQPVLVTSGPREEHK